MACNFNGMDVCDVDCIYPLFGEDCAGGGEACGPGTYWNSNTQLCEVSLVGDSDLDGCMTVADLLNLLSIYGVCPDLEAQAFSCGVNHVTFDGHDYATVQIGDACWFAENLRTRIYANGDSIAQALNGSEWGHLGQTQEPAQCTFGYDSLEVIDLRGRWYNAHAAYDERGVCPTGWHGSTEGDWVNLELGLGGGGAIYWPDESLSSEDNLNPVGRALRSVGFGNGTNTSGFGAVKGGSINGCTNGNGPPGTYVEPEEALFWSTVPGANDDAKRQRRRLGPLIYSVRETDCYGRGMSVRCVQD